MKNAYYLLFILTAGLATVKAADLELHPFVTDGCTMFVDGTKREPNLWRHCCVEHDIRYWFGGDQKDIDQADFQLKSCVNKVAGKTWAELIYFGVRAGHINPIKFSYHWGWGWTEKRTSRQPLSEEEKDYAIEEVRRLPYDQEMLDNFIKFYFPNENNQSN